MKPTFGSSHPYANAGVPRYWAEALIVAQRLSGQDTPKQDLQLPQIASVPTPARRALFLHWTGAGAVALLLAEAREAQRQNAHLDVVLVGRPVNFAFTRYDPTTLTFEGPDGLKGQFDAAKHVRERNYEAHAQSSAHADLLMQASAYSLSSILQLDGHDHTTFTLYNGGVAARAVESHIVIDYCEQLLDNSGKLLSASEYLRVVANLAAMGTEERVAFRVKTCQDKQAALQRGTHRPLAPLSRFGATWARQPRLNWAVASACTPLAALARMHTGFRKIPGEVRMLAGQWAQKGPFGDHLNVQADFDAFQSVVALPAFASAQVLLFPTEATGEWTKFSCVQLRSAGAGMSLVADMLELVASVHVPFAQEGAETADGVEGANQQHGFASRYAEGFSEARRVVPELALSVPPQLIANERVPVKVQMQLDKSALTGRRSVLEVLTSSAAAASNVMAYRAESVTVPWLVPLVPRQKSSAASVVNGSAAIGNADPFAPGADDEYESEAFAASTPRTPSQKDPFAESRATTAASVKRAVSKPPTASVASSPRKSPQKPAPRKTPTSKQVSRQPTRQPSISEVAPDGDGEDYDTDTFIAPSPSVGPRSETADAAAPASPPPLDLIPEDAAAEEEEERNSEAAPGEADLAEGDAAEADAPRSEEAEPQPEQPPPQASADEHEQAPLEPAPMPDQSEHAEDDELAEQSAAAEPGQPIGASEPVEETENESSAEPQSPPHDSADAAAQDTELAEAAPAAKRIPAPPSKKGLSPPAPAPARRAVAKPAPAKATPSRAAPPVAAAEASKESPAAKATVAPPAAKRASPGSAPSSKAPPVRTTASPPAAAKRTPAKPAPAKAAAPKAPPKKPQP